MSKHNDEIGQLGATISVASKKNQTILSNKNTEKKPVAGGGVRATISSGNASNHNSGTTISPAKTTAKNQDASSPPDGNSNDGGKIGESCVVTDDNGTNWQPQPYLEGNNLQSGSYSFAEEIPPVSGRRVLINSAPIGSANSNFTSNAITSDSSRGPEVDVNEVNHYFAQRVEQAQKFNEALLASNAPAAEIDKAAKNLDDCIVACALYNSERKNIISRNNQQNADLEYNKLSIRASKALMQRLEEDWEHANTNTEAYYMQRINQLGFIELVLKKNEVQSIRSGSADNDGIASIGSDAVSDADNSPSQVVAASVRHDEVFLAVKSFAPETQALPNTQPVQDVTVKLMGEKGKIANITDPRDFNTLSEDDKNKVALQQARMYLMKYYKPGEQIVIRGSDAEHKARIQAALTYYLNKCKLTSVQTNIVGPVNQSPIGSSFDTWIKTPEMQTSLNDDKEILVAVVNQRTTKTAVDNLRGTIMKNTNELVQAHEPPDKQFSSGGPRGVGS